MVVAKAFKCQGDGLQVHYQTSICNGKQWRTIDDDRIVNLSVSLNQKNLRIQPLYLEKKFEKLCHLTLVKCTLGPFLKDLEIGFEITNWPIGFPVVYTYCSCSQLSYGKNGWEIRLETIVYWRHSESLCASFHILILGISPMMRQLSLENLPESMWLKQGLR